MSKHRSNSHAAAARDREPHATTAARAEQSATGVRRAARQMSLTEKGKGARRRLAPARAPSRRTVRVRVGRVPQRAAAGASAKARRRCIVQRRNEAAAAIYTGRRWRDEGGGMRDEVKAILPLLHPSSLRPHPFFKGYSVNGQHVGLQNRKSGFESWYPCQHLRGSSPVADQEDDEFDELQEEAALPEPEPARVS